jgi:hypothetical protein
MIADALFLLVVYASTGDTLTFQPKHDSRRDLVKKFADDTRLLKACLEREYTGFFEPMETEFYDRDVQFIDPLTEFTGIDKYRANVDLLAGRTLLGSILFRDASILLHSVDDTGIIKSQRMWSPFSTDKNKFIKT